MNKQVMEKWVAALRSGKYKQGKDKLKKKDAKGVIRHCCLGVLCEVYNQENKNKKYTFTDREDQQLLPQEVEQWAEMHSNNGEITRSMDLVHYIEENGIGELDYTADNTLSDFNDNRRLKFSVLADIIEEFYKSM